MTQARLLGGPYHGKYYELVGILPPEIHLMMPRNTLVFYAGDVPDFEPPPRCVYRREWVPDEIRYRHVKEKKRAAI